MKTLVELFDKESIENILSSRVFSPETVVYICDEKVAQDKKNVIARMLKNWEMQNVKTVFYGADTSDYQNTYNVIEKVIKKYPDCIFDVNGGRDMAIFASGVLCKKHDIPCYFIDMHNLTFRNVNRCEDLAKQFVLPRFRVKDILASAGAKIEEYGKYRPDKKDTEMADDILKIWDILWQAPAAWSNQVGWFQQALKNQGSKTNEQLCFDSFVHIQIGQSFEARADLTILQKLYDIGVLTKFNVNKNHLNITFKNAPLKNCLMSQGIWLELYGFIQAYRLNWFNDVKTSVMIGWADHEISPTDIRNEIDILLVKGITPLFISCKMGMPNALALSEIKTLSSRFGGVLAKTVLLTGADVKNNNPTIYNRAKELDIHIIDKSDINANRVAKRFMQIAQTYNP